MKICIIDDNEEILELLKNVLTATGNDVVTINNGKDGLSSILSEKFDLIFLDITMPEFSGFDIVTYLHNNQKLEGNYIVFLTAASVSDSKLSEWYELGVKTCIRKPFEFDELFEQVMEAKIK